MFDPELHARFVRSSTNAFLEFSRASMAAAAAWQREASDPRPAPPSPVLPGFEMWTAAWKFWLESASAPVPDFWRNSRPSYSSYSYSASPAWPWFFGWPAPSNAAPASFMFSSPFAAFDWPMRMMPWSFYQSPLLGMMLSTGMPYTVAAPAARASTSAMEAAEAAQQQFQLMFSSYRTDSGHATAAF